MTSTAPPRAGGPAQVAGALLLVSGLVMAGLAISAVAWALRHPETEGHPAATVIVLAGVVFALWRAVLGGALLLRHGWARKASLPGLVLTTLTLVPALAGAPGLTLVGLALLAGWAAVTALPLALVVADLRRRPLTGI